MANCFQPPFISRLAAEDRCHLNGLAIVNGRAKYVTAVSQSDVAEGWRDPFVPAKLIAVRMEVVL